MLRIRALCVAVLFMATAPNSVAMAEQAASTPSPRFSRHVVALFSRLGCNGGTCHGAVQGQNGFRLSLFSANAAEDHQQLLRGDDGRRINLIEPEQSLVLLKATAKIAHEGGRRIEPDSQAMTLLRSWIEQGAKLDVLEDSRLEQLTISPLNSTVEPDQRFPLSVEATFADGSIEDVTHLCSFESRDPAVATIDAEGRVHAVGIGEAALVVRYRAEPAMASVVVPRPGKESFPDIKPLNFIDEQVLAKLRKLNLPPAEVADDATFLRRAYLDVAGELPTSEQVRSFLADKNPQKRAMLIDKLLTSQGHAALWALKFCDLLNAKEFGVYADGLQKEADAPRFHQWIRKRFEENTPYDQLVERILTATSRDGRTLEQWSDELIAMHEGATDERKDVEIYSQRKTLDLFWQRKAATGVPGALQVAHAFLGLRLECAQCHRHPHDVWQQDDLLSFANFFTRVRVAGFNGQNEKKYPEAGKLFKKLTEEGKKLAEEVKKLKESKGKTLESEARKAKQEAGKLKSEISRFEQQIKGLESQVSSKQKAATELPTEKKTDADRLQAEADTLKGQIAELQKMLTAKQTLLAPLLAKQEENEQFKQQVGQMDRRGKYLSGNVAKKVLHADIFHQAEGTKFASVTSPLGTQESETFRLLGQSEPLEVGKEVDPRITVMQWLREPENPFFAKAIVNRVWAHYFGRGLVNPPDDLSPLNPATHPELLDELCRKFIAAKYDLRWLHRTILNCRTYQQSSVPAIGSDTDRTHYAYFYYRRLPAEVMVDALNKATGTTDDMGMKYYHWPDGLKTVEIPTLPKNPFVNFMLEQFGRPPRNAAVQCDCQRDSSASMLQVLCLVNHPRIWQKISDPQGQVAQVTKKHNQADARLDEIFLATLSRIPDDQERTACTKYLQQAETPEKGLEGILWSLLNTREFLLQH